MDSLPANTIWTVTVSVMQPHRLAAKFVD